MSGVWTTIDFSQPGDQADFLRVPFSSDRSAYGWVPVPMFCLGSGAGPTALLTAGTHGDEYEGQIILRRLLSLLRGRPIAGRVILLPALNQPAVAAGLRNSPLDGGNLNRAFPGQPNAGVTAAIADYVTRVLFPLADLAIDLHSGGGSLDYLPVAFAHAGRTVDHAQRTARLLDSFAAPYSIVTNGRGGGGGSTLYGAAAAHGLPALTTELGGGHGLSPDGVNIGLAGVLRVLRDFGVVPCLEAPPAKAPCRLSMQPPETTIYARAHGLLEPRVGPGTPVAAGDLAGFLHPLDDPATPPLPLTFSASGIVVFRRHPTLTAPGDALFGLAAETLGG